MQGFGKATIGKQYGGGGGNKPAAPREKKVFPKNLYLEAGKKGADEGKHIIFRILPPMKSLANDGNGWRRKIGEHWGHFQPTRDPSKPRPLIFACCEVRDFKTKTISVECPKHIQMAQVKADYEALKQQFNDSDEAHQAELLPQLEECKNWIKVNRFSRQYNLNVMEPDGTFGILKLSDDTFKNKLDPIINGLFAKEGIDAVDYEQGVWFEAYRRGHLLDATDIIEVVREDVFVEGHGRLSKIKKAPLTEAQLAEALKVCYDLAKDTVAYLSPDQIQLLVDGSGDPEENLRVLGLGKKVEKEESPAPDVPKVVPVLTSSKVSISTGPGAPKVTGTVVPSTSKDPNQAFLDELFED